MYKFCLDFLLGNNIVVGNAVFRYNTFDFLQEHMFVFRLRNEKAAKHLWKCAVEHHSFFRLRTPVKGPSARQNFFRMGSRFRYSGRTEFQNTVTGQRSRRQAVQFERRPSQRYARRQSHVLREKDRERKKKEVEVKLEATKKKPEPEATKPTEGAKALEAAKPAEAATEVKTSTEAENRLDDLIKSLQKVSTSEATAKAATATSTTTSFMPGNATAASATTSESEMIPNNTVASTASPAKMPLDNYKNNILKAKSQDENKKVGGNAMLSFSTATSTTVTDEKSR